MNDADEFDGLLDAVTKAPLDPSRGIYRCSRCSACYHTDSYEMLQIENSGRCLACQSSSVNRVTRRKTIIFREQGRADMGSRANDLESSSPVSWLIPLILVILGIWIFSQPGSNRGTSTDNTRREASRVVQPMNQRDEPTTIPSTKLAKACEQDFLFHGKEKQVLLVKGIFEDRQGGSGAATYTISGRSFDYESSMYLGPTVERGAEVEVWYYDVEPPSVHSLWHTDMVPLSLEAYLKTHNEISSLIRYQISNLPLNRHRSAINQAQAELWKLKVPRKARVIYSALHGWLEAMDEESQYLEEPNSSAYSKQRVAEISKSLRFYEDLEARELERLEREAYVENLR